MRLAFLLLLAMLVQPVIGRAQQPLKWVELQPGFSIVSKQVWKSSVEDIEFDAIRFHLGYYNLNLIDVTSFVNTHKKDIEGSNDNRKFSDALLDTGVLNILKAYPKDSSPVAVISAGWSATLQKVEQIGLLKVNGVQIAEINNNRGMTAILCLDSPVFQGQGFEYQIPTFYRPFSSQEELIKRCTDTLQVGPRVIEDPKKMQDTHGIRIGEMTSSPQIRVVLAVDNPNRAESHPAKGRDSGRNVYFIITSNPVHLFSLQEMLLSSDFYGGPPVTAGWAINLVNGGPSGIAFSKPGSSDQIVFGNPSGVFGSAIVVTKKP